MTTSILARYTKAHQPAVFLLDSLDADKGEIQVWEAGEEPPRTVGLDYYRNTVPVSDAVEADLVERFRKAFSPPGGIILRRRLWKINPDHPSYVPPAKQEEKQPEPKYREEKHNVLETPENKAAQQRESAPHETKQATQSVQQHNPLGDIEKVLLVERITHAFATSFAKSMGEALKEALK